MSTDWKPDVSTPIGDYRQAWIGYSADEEIRSGAASGGVVSSVLVHLLETGRVDAALLCRSRFAGGKMTYDVYLGRTREDVLGARTSKYFDIPLLQGVQMIREFQGRVAVVGLPSQMNAISRICRARPEFADKVRFKIALFCGHNSKDALIRKVWEKHGIDENEIEDFHFRKGLWRGQMVVELKSGETRRLRFQEFSHYQNLHVLSLERCLNCFDHMGYYADMSVGDVWTREMRGKSIKHSVFLARSAGAEAVVGEMIAKALLVARPASREDVYRSQLRSINYHYNITARARIAKWFGFRVRDPVHSEVNWRDMAAAFIVLLNHRISLSPLGVRIFMKLPMMLVAAYLYLFKALMHYRRKSY